MRLVLLLLACALAAAAPTAPAEYCDAVRLPITRTMSGSFMSADGQLQIVWECTSVLCDYFVIGGPNPRVA